MTLIKSERRVLEHLTNNGATTKPELMVSTGYSRCTIGNSIRTLLAAKRVARHDLRTVPGHPQRLPSFVAVTELPKPAPTSATVNVFEHPEIYTRLNGLESKLGRLNHSITDLEKALTGLAQRENSLNTRLNTTIKYVNDFEIERIRIEDGMRADRSRLDGFASRLTALEKPQPAVDPVYAEIEQDLTDKLGGQVSPNLLRTFIEEAYAERAK
jgi:hypothetical protein